MAEFVASPITNAGFDPQDVQKNALNIQAQQQDLADRATFRQNALGAAEPRPCRNRGGDRVPTRRPARLTSPASPPSTPTPARSP